MRRLGMDRRMTVIWFLLFALYFFSSRFSLDGYELEYVLSSMNVFHGNGPSMARGFQDCPGVWPTTGSMPQYPRQNLLQTYLSVPLYAAGAIILGEKPTNPESAGYWKIPWGPLVTVSMLNPMLAALLAVLVGLIAHDLGIPSPKHRLLAILYGVTSMNWHYGTMGMEVVQTAVLLLGIWSAIRFRLTARSTWLMSASMFIALLPLCKKISFLFTVPLVIYVVCSIWRHNKKSGRIAYAIVAAFTLFGLITMTAVLWNRFHLDPELFPHFLRTYLSGRQPFINLLIGLTVSPGEGIIPFNPLIVFGLLSWQEFHRSHRSEARLFLGVALIVFLILLILPYALLDEEWGPRYLFILLPLIYIAGAQGLLARRTGMAKKLFLTILIISLGIQWLSSMFLGFKLLDIPLSMGVSDYTLCIFTPSLSQIWLAATCFVSHVHLLVTGESMTFSHREYSNYIGIGGIYRDLRRDLTDIGYPAGGIFTVRWALSELGMQGLTPVRAFLIKLLADTMILSLLAVQALRAYRGGPFTLSPSESA